MKITYYTHSPENYKSRHIQVGNHVVGVRLLSLEVTSGEELEQLLSEKGIKWAKQNLRFGRQPVGQQHVEATLTDNPRESHWGSDWVDDGV